MIWKPYILAVLLSDRFLNNYAWAFAHGAGDGNRTRVTCLEGRCSTIELHRHVERTRLVVGRPSRSGGFHLRRVTREGLVGLSGVEPASSDYEPDALTC